jgi:hypothetical protein
MIEIDIESPGTAGRRPVSGELLQTLQESIDVLELSVRPYNCAKNVNIGTIAGLAAKSEGELLAVKNFNRKALNEVREALLQKDLSLGSKFYERHSGRELQVAEVLRVDAAPQIEAERSKAAAVLAHEMNDQLRSEIAYVFKQAGIDLAWPMPTRVQDELSRRLKLARAVDEYTKG